MAVNPYAFWLVGSWINCMLFMLELVLMVQYLQTSTRPLIHRIYMGAIFIFDAICTAAICAEVYLNVLELGCPTAEFPSQEWIDSFFTIVAVTLFASYATASMEQLFLCYLYFNLTKRRWITGFLVLCVAVHLGFSYASAGLVWTSKSPFGAALMTSKVGGISCAVTDILIAAVLLFTFVRLEKNSVVRLSMQNLLRRLMLLIATSGVLVATNTVLAIVLLLQGNAANTLFNFCQGRIYALTVLANFLVGNLKEPSSYISGNLTLPPTAITDVVFNVGTVDERTRDCPSDRGHDVEMDSLSFTPSKTLPHESSDGCEGGKRSQPSG